MSRYVNFWLVVCVCAKYLEGLYIEHSDLSWLGYCHKQDMFLFVTKARVFLLYCLTEERDLVYSNALELVQLE